MGRDTASARAKLGKNMSQFVSQSTIDFGWMLKEPGIERNDLLTIVSAASGCFQACIPFDAKIPRNARRAE
jgi:hypothetical protein